MPSIKQPVVSKQQREYGNKAIIVITVKKYSMDILHTCATLIKHIYGVNTQKTLDSIQNSAYTFTFWRRFFSRDKEKSNEMECESLVTLLDWKRGEENNLSRHTVWKPCTQPEITDSLEACMIIDQTNKCRNILVSHNINKYKTIISVVYSLKKKQLSDTASRTTPRPQAAAISRRRH